MQFALSVGFHQFCKKKAVITVSVSFFFDELVNLPSREVPGMVDCGSTRVVS